VKSILVAYASKSGTAKEAAGKIAAVLPNAELIDLADVSSTARAAKTPLHENYCAAIIGGGVRVGLVHGETKRFIDARKEELETLPSAYFITNCFPESVDEIIGKMLPASLKDSALFVGTLGGRLDINSLRGLDKVIAKMVSKAVGEQKPVFSELDEHAIQTLVSKFL
jgi:menaquinone-dependent protoporphyrinogen IX oxidase